MSSEVIRPPERRKEEWFVVKSQKARTDYIQEPIRRKVFLDCSTSHGRNLVEPPSIDPITPTVSEEIEKKFIRLRDQWKSEMAHVSSTSRLVLHPAYQAIIGMGPDIVPLLLRELERRVDLWFWALHAITGADPVPPKSSGDGKEMAKAWLAWGKEQGYQW